VVDFSSRQITELSIIIPTRNERENILPLVSSISQTLPQIPWEIIFVDDDSPDNTADVIRELAQSDPRIRLIRRLGRNGLSSAALEGMLSSTAKYLALMDADLQHDESLLAEMLDKLKSDHDLVIASRYLPNASSGGLSESRRFMSRVAIRFTEFFLNTRLSDSMSGFFMLRGDLFDLVVRHLYGRGFKLLLDIISAGAALKIPMRVLELPYAMRARQHGTSKLDINIVIDLIILILYRYFSQIAPVHFLAYSFVGLIGVGVNMLFLWIFLHMNHWPYLISYTIALYLAMTSNYLLNNEFTFRSRRLRGINFFNGLLRFFLACSVGALVSISISTVLFEKLGSPWWIAGLCGVLVSALWNFLSSTNFVWGITHDD